MSAPAGSRYLALILDLETEQLQAFEIAVGPHGPRVKEAVQEIAQSLVDGTLHRIQHKQGGPITVSLRPLDSASGGAEDGADLRDA
jgi:hypothetical protein